MLKKIIGLKQTFHVCEFKFNQNWCLMILDELVFDQVFFIKFHFKFMHFLKRILKIPIKEEQSNAKDTSSHTSCDNQIDFRIRIGCNKSVISMTPYQ